MELIVVLLAWAALQRMEDKPCGTAYKGTAQYD